MHKGSRKLPNTPKTLYPISGIIKHEDGDNDRGSKINENKRKTQRS